MYAHVTIQSSKVHALPGKEGAEKRCALAVVVKPELGPHGVFMRLTPGNEAGEIVGGLVVVGRSCIVADAAAAAATAIVPKPEGFRTALRYLRGLPGLYGALVIEGHRIGVTGALELAA